MRLWRSAWLGVVLGVAVAAFGGCAGRAEVAPAGSAEVGPVAAGARGGMGWNAVLVAGDGSVPAFDNAVERFERLLEEGAHVPAGNVRRLSSAPAVIGRAGVAPAGRERVLRAIEAMRPGAGQGCLVFATSHGVRGRGLYLGVYGEVLDPASLDRALSAGCGEAPTVVIVSGCFSGGFARAPMARPNRVVLTAAREDRASFGCGAENVLTDYDGCLLEALRGGGTWRAVYARVRPCVAWREDRGRFLPSLPQAWFGGGVERLVVVGG